VARNLFKNDFLIGTRTRTRTRTVEPVTYEVKVLAYKYLLFVVCIWLVKVKQYVDRPGQALKIRKYEVSIFQENRSMKLVKLSALALAAFISLAVLLVLIFVSGWAEIRTTVPTERIMWMKNSIDTIGNQTRDLPSCSTTSEPTAPPPIPLYIFRLFIFPLPYFGFFSATTRSFPCRFLTMFTIPHFSIKIQLWYSYDTAMIQLWYSYDTAMIQLWYSYDTAMIQLWYSYDTAMIHI
jgi:hypothetical protein